LPVPPRPITFGVVTKIVSLPQAVSDLVHDGDTVAIEGRPAPFAAAHEIVRQSRRGLTLVRSTADLLCDQLVGAGSATTLVLARSAGALPRVADARAHAWPGPLTVADHSHGGLLNRYVAGASGLPFAVVRSYTGTDVAADSPVVAGLTCPFTGERLTALAALNPDVTILHAQRADRTGNVQFWGGDGVRKEAVFAARRALVTVEEVVDELADVEGAVVLPAFAITAVAVVPNGAAPSAVPGHYDRDDDAYRDWDTIGRDRAAFTRWREELEEKSS
jgi:glutaconate CoA-transferase subunit A